MFKVNNISATITPEGIYPILKNDAYFGKHRKITENTLLFLTILTLRLNDKKDKFLNERSDGFQEISTTLIIKLLSRDNYLTILNRLTELKIIAIDPKYLVNQLCKSYRITDKFALDKLVARKIKYPYVKKRLDIMNDYFSKKCLEKYPYLTNQYQNLQKIHIEYNEVMNWIEINKDVFNLDDVENAIGRTANYRMQAFKVSQGYIRKISVSDTNHRLHSSMTGFPKMLRPFLGIMNEHTNEILYDKVIIDGCNTQPLLVCLRMESVGVIPDKDFKDWCLDGTIYYHICNELKENKSWVKTRFMDTLLFTLSNGSYALGMKNPKGSNLDKQKFTRYFKKRFPIVYNWLLKTKKELKDAASAIVTKKKSHNMGGRELALIIQRMEADMWIHALLPELPNDLIYVTIHDAVMLFSPTEVQVKAVELKIKEIGFRMYGIEIPLKTEYFGEKPVY